MYRFFIVFFIQMLKKNDLLEELYKSIILQQIKLVAIYTDENDLACRELFSRIHLKNDEISSLFFNAFGRVTVLVQVQPNIASLSCWCRCYQISHCYRVGAGATKYRIAIVLVQVPPNIASLLAALTLTFL